VNFAFSAEQEEIRDTLRSFLESRAPISETRRWMETERGFDEGFWSALAEELGLQGLLVPEALGGTGFGAVELTVVMEEMGRALVCAPYFSTVALAGHALLELAGEDAQREWLPQIASGELVATLAVTERSGRWDPAGVELVAKPNGGGHVLHGEKCFVTDGQGAGLLLVVARVDAAWGLFAVEADAAGLRREALPSLDPTRPHANLVLDAVPGSLVGPVVEWPAIQKVLDLACVALTAEQVGAAQRVLDMAVEYAKVREQFGRPIGSFQAIKHKCADMLLRIEAARSAAYYAGWVASQGTPELRSVTSIAKADVSEAFLHVAEENLQIHGGLGFTWEQDPHLFLKRARSSFVLLGDPAFHRRLTADELLG
jgi:alkylation response protein AidB-like acyl-CoA dehydrogenase